MDPRMRLDPRETADCKAGSLCKQALIDKRVDNRDWRILSGGKKALL